MSFVTPGQRTPIPPWQLPYPLVTASRKRAGGSRRNGYSMHVQFGVMGARAVNTRPTANARRSRFAFGRVLGTLLIVTGLGAVAWALVVWQWQDPFTWLYTR